MITGHAFRYALAFTMLGVLGIAFGSMLGLAGASLIWFGLTMLTVGANYAFPQHFAVFRKTHGKLGLVRKLILLPYVAMLYGTWHLLRKASSQAPFVELTQGIFIGRRLLPIE